MPGVGQSGDEGLCAATAHISPKPDFFFLGALYSLTPGTYGLLRTDN